MEIKINDSAIVNLNNTVNDVVQYFNTSGENSTKAFDLAAEYEVNKKELIVYKKVACIFGVIIMLSNLAVVISSGLILKKGQQPKSTYLLLGNVSLADTIIGFFIIFDYSVYSHENSSNTLLCIFQIGMLVCAMIVSIFSVGLIAVDRYIYILHGLYYQRWFNTTKVRIAIVCIWIIGISLGFIPVTGWRNHELDFVNRCSYVTLFPKQIVVLNASLSTLPIILVAVLYSIILVKALKNLNKIQASKKLASNTSDKKDDFRAISSKTNDQIKVDKCKCNDFKNETGDTIKHSASLGGISDCRPKHTSLKSITLDKLAESKDHLTHSCETIETKDDKTGMSDNPNFSIYMIQSTSDHNALTSSVAVSPDQKVNKCKHSLKKLNPIRPKEPKILRAITVVMLTSGSFICTWLPLLITVIFFVLCEDKHHNRKCFQILATYGAPVTALATLNSILNPLIYAWWHKGFKKSIRLYFNKYYRKQAVVPKLPLLRQKTLNK